MLLPDPSCGGSVADPENLYRHLVKAFSRERSMLTPAERARVQTYIYDYLQHLAQQINWDVITQEFDVVSKALLIYFKVVHEQWPMDS